MAENIENNGCSQRDNAEHEGYVKASRSFNRIWKERDSAQPRLLEAILYKDNFATVYKGNIIKNLIMDCQSYTKYRPNETTGGIFVSWRRKEELPTGA